MKKQIKICVLVFSLFLFSRNGFAQIEVFKGKGQAVVINNNHKKANKIAYQAAKKKAIVEAMRSLFYKGRKDEVNFNHKRSQLLKGPFLYIQKEKEVTSTLKDKLLIIEIELSIEMKSLERFLGKKGVLVVKNKEKKKSNFPSIMILVNEEINGKLNVVSYSQAVISNYLIKNKYEILDEKIVQKNITQEQAIQAVNGNMAAAKVIALQYGSGVVLTGKTVVQASSMKSGGMQVYGANSVLRAIKADTGRVLATASAEGNFPHINAMTGSRKAAEQAVLKAIKKIP